MENKLKANGESKSIRQLLDTQKYYLDFYQREYKWTRENVIELLSDLENKFLLNWDEKQERLEVQNYSHYFLGSIIVSEKKNEKFIVDGQQRLTTITLLLIYLNKLQRELLHEKDDETLIENLIYSKKYGKKSFNIDIHERKAIMEAIFTGKTHDTEDKTHSIKNIKYRYDDIEENFPDTLKYSNNKLVLPFFIDWFLDNVDLVEITTYSEDDAYTIFETMNDRGLSLSPADMLKGYILTNIKDDIKRDEANGLWRYQITKLIEYNKKEEFDFFKAWLRAKYAETIREGKKGASNKDFEVIGVQFHRWVRDNKEKLKLRNSNDFFNFIEEFVFYSKIYLDLKFKSDNLTKGYEELFYNNYNNFTLQYPLIFATIKLDDSKEDIQKKIKLVTRFIDTFVVLRSINHRTLGYSAIYYTIFNLIKKIRDSDVDVLSKLLKEELEQMDVRFDGAKNLVLHSQNKRFIQYLLARITNYIELKSKRSSNFASYIQRNIKDPFEIEHIIPNRYADYMDDFLDQMDFDKTRNKLGDLLLLPSSFNKSYGDKPFEIKVKQYIKHNLLAQSLNEQCYENDPHFLNFKTSTSLPFQSYNKFLKNEIFERQSLYVSLIKKIWNLNEFNYISRYNPSHNKVTN